MLVDTHAHITRNDYDNIDEVLENAKNNGISKILNCSTSVDDIEEILFLCKKHSILYSSLGIHPDMITNNVFEDLELLENYIKNNKIYAIGEIGLDYYHSSENKDIQKKVFIYQLDLALKYNLPVSIHSRDSLNDIFEILEKYNLKGVIHCFSGSYETACKFIKLGYSLGIGGIVTFNNCKLVDTLKMLPLENIVLETDSPYLTPVPERGIKNEPKHIKTIAEYLSKELGISYEEFVRKIYKNVSKIFDLND